MRGFLIDIHCGVIRGGKSEFFLLLNYTLLNRCRCIEETLSMEESAPGSLASLRNIEGRVTQDKHDLQAIIEVICKISNSFEVSVK